MRGQLVRRWFYAGSVVFHALLAVAAYSLPKEQEHESVAIELADIRKKNEKPKPPPPPPPPPPKEKPKPPPPPPPPPPQAQAKTSLEPKAEAPAAEPAGQDGFADLGSVAVGNGGGGGGGDEGVAVGGPAKPGAKAAPRSKVTVHKEEQLAPAAKQACTEPDVPPEHVSMVNPKSTQQALVAEIEGVVIVEMTIDTTGAVIEARIVRGLGYGLDEVAVKAAMQWKFRPSTRCGKAIASHKKVAFRFELT